MHQWNRNQLITKSDSPSDTKEKAPILVPKAHKKSTFGTSIGTFLCFSAYFSIFYSTFAHHQNDKRYAANYKKS